MKTTRIFFLLTFLFCSGNHLFGQPGESDEKHNIHEIKLHEREDGSKVGAIAWSTAPSDSVQKFVVRNLSIMEPVQVLLQALSPNDKVTLQFVKEKWGQSESNISAKGKKIGKKIFRTYKTAAMKISAQKSGVPYMIFVQVGIKLPVKSANLIKITNDKEEYENYLKNQGKNSENKTDADSAVIPVTNNENGGVNTPNNSSLLYIIIGLLALMVALLGYFVFVRKGSKKVLVVIFLLGLSINAAWSQEGGPIQLFPTNTGNGSPYTDAGITAMVNQTLIVDLYKRLSEQAARLAILDDSYDYLNEQLNTLYDSVYEGLAELSETDSYLDGAYLDLRNEFEAFKNDFADNMPGENTEGGNRVLPQGLSEEELNLLKTRIRQLEYKVAFLSERDRTYLPDEGNEEQIVVYCEEIRACSMCISDNIGEFIDVEANLRELNRIIKRADWLTETGIATGNALANSAPGIGLGWHKQLLKIQKSRKNLWKHYHDKYRELSTTGMDKALYNLRGCIRENNPGGDMHLNLDRLKESALRNNPEVATPLF
jgi:hypothetical protein